MGAGIASSHEYDKKQYMPELLRRCTLLLPSLGFTRFRDIKDVRSLPTILISLGLLITLSTTVGLCENKMADFIAPF